MSAQAISNTSELERTFLRVPVHERDAKGERSTNASVVSKPGVFVRSTHEGYGGYQSPKYSWESCQVSWRAGRLGGSCFEGWLVRVLCGLFTIRVGSSSAQRPCVSA